MSQLSPLALISNRKITLLYLAIDGMAPIDGPLEFDFPLIANTMVRFIFVRVCVYVYIYIYIYILGWGSYKWIPFEEKRSRYLVWQ